MSNVNWIDGEEDESFTEISVSSSNILQQVKLQANRITYIIFLCMFADLIDHVSEFTRPYASYLLCMTPIKFEALAILKLSCNILQ